MSYKYLLFDADNTLFDFDKCERNAFLSLKDILPDVFTEENLVLYHNINDNLWKEVEKGNVSKTELKLKRFKQLLSELQFEESNITPEDLSVAYIKRLSKQNELINGATNILEYLCPKYNIYVITNGISTVQKNRFAASQINSFIKKVFKFFKKSLFQLKNI